MTDARRPSYVILSPRAGEVNDDGAACPRAGGCGRGRELFSVVISALAAKLLKIVKRYGLLGRVLQRVPHFPRGHSPARPEGLSGTTPERFPPAWRTGIAAREIVASSDR